MSGDSMIANKIVDKTLSQCNKYILDRHMQQKTSEQSSSNFHKVTTTRWHVRSIYNNTDTVCH